MPIGCFEARWARPVATTPKPPGREPSDSARSGWRRLLWFVGLWGVSVLMLYLISLLIRWAIVP
jgi:fatty acid desaturase